MQPGTGQRGFGFAQRHATDMTGRQYVALTVSPGMPLPSFVPPKPGAVLTDEPLTRKAPICQLQPQRSSFSPGHKTDQSRFWTTVVSGRKQPDCRSSVLPPCPASMLAIATPLTAPPCIALSPWAAARQAGFPGRRKCPHEGSRSRLSHQQHPGDGAEDRARLPCADMRQTRLLHTASAHCGGAYARDGSVRFADGFSPFLLEGSDARQSLAPRIPSAPQLRLQGGNGLHDRR